MTEHDASAPSEGLEPPVAQPLLVPKNATHELITMVTRYILVLAAGYLMARGLVDERTRNLLIAPETINVIVPLIAAVVPVLLGGLKVKRNNAVQQTMANALPDNIAKVEH